MVPVTGVNINEGNQFIDVGGTFSYTATVTPSNATDQNVVWSSSSASATVRASGQVTGVSPGTVIITAAIDGFNDTVVVVITGPNSFNAFVQDSELGAVVPNTHETQNCFNGPNAIAWSAYYNYIVNYSGTNVDFIQIRVNGVIENRTPNNVSQFVIVEQGRVTKGGCFPELLPDNESSAIYLRFRRDNGIEDNTHVLDGGSYQIRAVYLDGSFSIWEEVIGSDD